MKRSSDRKIHQTLTAAIKRFFKKQPLDPDDPYALVTAPKKPGPQRGAPPSR
jgi:hypothetical protein